MRREIKIINETLYRFIPDALEREFSLENFSAFIKMCEQVAVWITDILEGKQRGKRLAILLPSRGALPIFSGAMLAMRYLGWAEKITLPPLECFNYVRRSLGLQNRVDRSNVEVLIFPFTADINIKVRKKEEERIIRDMRSFGARVVAEFFKPPEKRNGLEYLLFLTFLAVVEKRKNMVDFYRSFPRVDGLVMIDTVISGRASWSILNELERLGIKMGKGVMPILVIDAGGRKLKPQFRSYVDRCPYCITIPRIMTEDRGAALEGVVAVVYPNLILAAHERQDIYPQGYPLFGSWHNIPPHARDSHLGVFEAFLEVVRTSIDGGDILFARDNFLKKLQLNRVLMTGGKVIRGEELNPHWHIKGLEETSAHVIQITYPDSTINGILREMAKRLR